MTVNPSILEWARETAGLSQQTAAKALGFSDSKRRSATERLAALEGGKDEPSRSVLFRMAKAYRRPLVVFYLEQPPPKGERGQDFRTVSAAGQPQFNPVLDALIRDVHGRQGILRGLLEDEDAEPLDFIASADLGTPAHQLVAEIPKSLDFSLEEFRRQPTPEQAFSYLRSKLENSGIFVLLLGNLGSFHTNIPVDVFRGFSIADRVAPVIVINDQDVNAAWSFTALHETVHLWLGNTGVSSTNTDTRIEKYCNDIASAILLPESDTRELTSLARTRAEVSADEISRFARARNVSRAMVAYKLFRLDLITKDTWNNLSAKFRTEWLEQKTLEREQTRDEEGPSYYVVRRHRLGQGLIGLVRRSLAEGVLSYTKAARVLGVKPRNVAPLLYGKAVQGSR